MRRKPHPYYDIRMDKVKLVSNTRIYLDVNALLDEILDIKGHHESVALKKKYKTRELTLKRIRDGDY